jgi:hypothetical protein
MGVARPWASLGVIFLLALSIGGCGTVPARNSLPETLGESAETPCIPRARFWDDEVPSLFEAIAGQPREKLQTRFPANMGRGHRHRAVSGGGANGALGAGLLAGWSAAGTRPEFTTVAGIGTLIIAPSAFLGPAYDSQLEEMYTESSTKDLRIRHSLRKAVTGPPKGCVVRNPKLPPDGKTVKAGIFPIAGVSIDSLLRTQGIGDTYRTCLDGQREGLDFHLAFIPDEFDLQPTEDFVPVCTGKLRFCLRFGENGVSPVPGASRVLIPTGCAGLPGGQPGRFRDHQPKPIFPIPFRDDRGAARCERSVSPSCPV